ncbi:abortive infection family protein [Flavobacterium aquidurense]|uniref:abortive infection family protein n=1 Tax=Flavobacterium aquidurense TaxID=362413 RepID=UPI003716F9CF
MNKTLSIISANILKHSHFEEYFKIIELIKSNENINPDICIESCKALVEGISKTILFDLDNTKTKDNIDKDDLPKLFKDAMRVLSDNCEDIEGDFASRFSAIMQVIGEIRNKRGDISHGRMAPKFIFSSSKLSSTIVNMTDTMMEYILEHYFSIEISKSTLVYESDKLKEYNEWLDNSLIFPIKKAKYSKLLFENDYNEYETRYKDEFIGIIELDSELRDGIFQIIEALRGQFANEVKTEDIQTIIEFEKISDVVIPYQENLVNTFDEEAFWTVEKSELLENFANQNDFHLEALKNLINDYLAFEVEPLRDDIRRIMINLPPLIDRKNALILMLATVVDFAEALKK